MLTDGELVLSCQFLLGTVLHKTKLRRGQAKALQLCQFLLGTVLHKTVNIMELRKVLGTV